jgi:hypothetical protein
MDRLERVVLGQIILKAFSVQPTGTSEAFLHQQLGSASSNRQLHRINPAKLASDMASLDVVAIIEDKLSKLSHCEAISETDRAQMLVTMVDTPAAIRSLVDILAPLSKALARFIWTWKASTCLAMDQYLSYRSLFHHASNLPLSMSTPLVCRLSTPPVPKERP